MLCKQFDWNIYGSYVRCISFYYFLLYGAGISYETIYCNYLGNLHPCFDIPHTHLAVIELFSSVCYLKLFFISSSLNLMDIDADNLFGMTQSAYVMWLKYKQV